MHSQNSYMCSCSYLHTNFHVCLTMWSCDVVLLHVHDHIKDLIHNFIDVFLCYQQAINLGITYKISLTCNNNYVIEKRIVNVLSASFSLPKNVTVDNIWCKLLVSIDNINSVSIRLYGKKICDVFAIATSSIN